MRRIVLLMHTSLDGYVAGADGDMGWILHDQEVFSYVSAHIEKASTALYGRVTYQMMESYWPTILKNPAGDTHALRHAHWIEAVEKVVEQLGKFSRVLKPGFSILAKRTGVPVLPVAIEGAFNCWPRWRRFPGPGPIQVEFGRPIKTEELNAGDDRQLVTLVQQRIEECQALASLRLRQRSRAEGASASRLIGLNQGTRRRHSLIAERVGLS